MSALGGQARWMGKSFRFFAVEGACSLGVESRQRAAGHLYFHLAVRPDRISFIDRLHTVHEIVLPVSVSL